MAGLIQKLKNMLHEQFDPWNKSYKDKVIQNLVDAKKLTIEEVYALKAEDTIVGTFSNNTKEIYAVRVIDDDITIFARLWPSLYLEGYNNFLVITSDDMIYQKFSH